MISHTNTYTYVCVCVQLYYYTDTYMFKLVNKTIEMATVCIYQYIKLRKLSEVPFTYMGAY